MDTEPVPAFAVQTMLKFFVLSAISAFLLGPCLAQEPVFINEFMANNATSIRDENNDPSDWIELRNTSPTPVNLNGYFLTDTPSNLQKWRLPSTNIAANGYLIIYASGKDRLAPRLHANFSLNADGEYLALVKPDGITKISEFLPVQQYKDFSYGFDQTGTNLVYFSRGTPGTANGGGVVAFVQDTKFSQDRGYYDAPFDLAITTATPGATIRYTINGTVPTLSNGITYTSGVGIRISGTAIIRAAAFLSGFQPSNVDTHTYLFLDDVIRQAADGRAPAGWPTSWGANTVDYGMDTNVVNDPLYRDTIKNDLKTLPSFSIVMNLNDLFNPSSDPSVGGIYANPGQDGRPWERPCSVEFLRTDGVDGFHVNAGLRIRGGFSRSTGNPKHAFRLFFREEYGDANLNYPLFGDNGTDKFNNLDLRTFQNYSWSFQGDSAGVFIRDVFSRDTQLAMGHQGERGDYCHLYINGLYWGIYNTCERTEASYGETYWGGKKDDYDVIKVEAGPYAINATDGNMNAWTMLHQMATAGLSSNAAYFKTQGLNPDGARNPAFTNLVDVPNLIDYMLVIIYGGNKDAPISNFLGNDRPNNWYGLRNRDGQHGGFRFIAHDSEHTLLPGDIAIDRTGPFAAGQNGLSYSNPQYIWQQMSANAEFRLKVADHVHRHFFNGGLLTPEAGIQRFRKRMAELDRAVVAESARWGDAKREPAYTRATWLAACNNVLNNWLPRRSATNMIQLRAKNLYPNVTAPSFNQHGGNVPANFQLTLSAPAGSIYYTLDGSDPRLVGGAVSPAAKVYSGAIPLRDSTRVLSRVLSGATWSALNEADFFVIRNFRDLLITEIMYHPVTREGYDSNDLEFLELKNASSAEMDLSGIRFTNGISYTFPLGAKLASGAFAILVRNPTAFTNYYPGVAFHGEFTNKLSDSGERIDLVHASGNPIFSVDYRDSSPWPLGPDGGGFSLVPTNPNSNPDPNSAANWRASSRLDGSPGRDDPPADVFSILVTEALTHTDLPAVDSIELFNPNTEPVDIGGWFLSDDRFTPRKYRIPSPTVIEPGAYVVFTEDAFNSPPGSPGAFSLSSHGDEVFLSSADAAGNLTGFTDGFSFGAAENGVSFGRHTNSAGAILFTAQVAPSLGAANLGPRVGPVVINEIRYWPRPGDEEFIEIRNLTGAEIRLFDPAHPTNRWRINGADFTFPPNSSIPAGGYAVIASVDPTLFRAHNSVPPAIPVFGPFQGALQDNGEMIELQRPDSPDPDPNGGFIVPYITVDAVRYDDRAPWPTSAAGSGPSLERVNSSAFGNEPANWRASAGPASPGIDNNGNRPPQVNAGQDASLTSALFPISVSLAATATDDGQPTPSALAFNWTLVSGPGIVDLANPSSHNTTASLPGLGRYVFRVTVTDGELVATDDVEVQVTRPLSTQIIVARGSTWKYLADNSNQGTAWRANDFPDSSWPSGPARLGFGGDGEVTTIPGGPSNARWITTYFRRTFNVPSVSGLRDLTAHLLRDDGAVVYLNGTEIFRSNLPAGAITSTTYASSAGEEQTYYEQQVSITLLRAGANVLAVEVHQVNATSSDLSFDFELVGTFSSENSRPIVNAGPDLAIALPQSAQLAGAVFDDGLPDPPGVPTSAWTKVSGPGAVTFANPAAPRTTAQFSAPGAYVLRLSTTDGQFAASDEMTVEVRPDNAYAGWQSFHFSTAELSDPAISGDSADPDGDSFRNLAEYIAGTNPRDPQSFLTLDSIITQTGVALRFDAVPGRAYEILTRESIDSGIWDLVRSVDPGASPQVIQMELHDAASEPNRFFRLAIPAP